MKSKIHQSAKHFLASKFFYYFILAVIVINAIAIGLETYAPVKERFELTLHYINRISLAIFIFEFLLRIYVLRLSFFKRKWDDFDLIVVIVSILPESSVFSVFRFLRVIRLLRLLPIIPKMKLISEVLLRSLSSILSVGVLLMIVYYVYAVITTTLYGDDFPQWFGSIWESYYTLFQIMTFEGWSMGIVRPIMAVHPNAWAVFISFLIIATYIVLNIVIGIIVDCIGDIKEKDGYVEKDRQKQEELIAKISHLENQLEEIKSLISDKR